MILLEFEIPQYNWTVDVFYVIDTYCKEAIESYLNKILCDDNTKLNILNKVDSKEYNIGFTFTNISLRKSLIIMGPTTSAEEFANTYDHEKNHLIAHIGKANNLDMYGESTAYLSGEIGLLMFKIAKLFMCNKCRDRMMFKFKRVVE